MARTTGDLKSYYSFASKIFSGELPYRDFSPEYPPFSMFFLSLPNISGEKYYTLIYYCLVAICLVIIAYLINKMGGKMWAMVASILPIGGMFWDKFDIFPACLTTLAIFLASRNNLILASFVISLGFLTKLYPIFLMPIITIMLLSNRKQILNSVLAFFLPIIIILGIIIGYGGKDGLVSFVNYQSKRGIGLESVRATLLLWQNLRGNNDLIVKYDHNSYEIKIK